MPIADRCSEEGDMHLRGGSLKGIQIDLGRLTLN